MILDRFYAYKWYKLIDFIKNNQISISKKLGSFSINNLAREQIGIVCLQWIQRSWTYLESYCKSYHLKLFIRKLKTGEFPWLKTVVWSTHLDLEMGLVPHFMKSSAHKRHYSFVFCSFNDIATCYCNIKIRRDLANSTYSKALNMWLNFGLYLAFPIFTYEQKPKPQWL